MLERQQDPLFRASLTLIRDKVKTGVALSEAFRSEGPLYPPILSASGSNGRSPNRAGDTFINGSMPPSSPCATKHGARGGRIP